MAGVFVVSGLMADGCWTGVCQMFQHLKSSACVVALSITGMHTWASQSSFATFWTFTHGPGSLGSQIFGHSHMGLAV